MPCFRVRSKDTERSAFLGQYLVRFKDRDVFKRENSSLSFCGSFFELVLNCNTVRIRAAIQVNRLGLSLVN